LVEGLYLGDIFYGSEESFGAYVRCIFDWNINVYKIFVILFF
jgi:hypothetical protein